MQHVKLFNKTAEEPQEVLALRYGRPEGRTNKKNEKCSRCAYAHEPRKCPAYNQTCRNCQRRGHFAEVCFFKDQNNSVQRRVSEVTEAQVQNINVFEGNNVIYDNASDNNSVFICEQKYQICHNKNYSWYENVKINNINISFKLDTGAESSVLPLKYFTLLKIKMSDITPTSMIIISYGNFKSKPLGYITLQCEYKRVLRHVKFLVVELDSEPILGLNDCLSFNMICRIDSVNKLLDGDIGLPKSKQYLFLTFKVIFEGLGCMPGVVDIKLKADAHPVVQIQRKVPLALRERLKSTFLKDLKQKNIISKVDYPTDWRVRDRTCKVRMENGSLLYRNRKFIKPFDKRENHLPSSPYKDLRNLKEEGESSHKNVYIRLENISEEVGQELENINSEKVEESDEETRSDSVISEKDKSSNLRDGKIINLDFGENSNNIEIEIDHSINHETDTSSEDNSVVYETGTSHLVNSYGRKIKCPQRLDL
uniref:Uncharacterized protein LOC114341561 n=1 Tax=Diabrotica virgifera virgifera TaxID=50390 RepID=A0A6P7GEY3_DIAVI